MTEGPRTIVTKLGSLGSDSFLLDYYGTITRRLVAHKY
jgi:hypothetical protein